MEGHLTSTSGSKAGNSPYNPYCVGATKKFIKKLTTLKKLLKMLGNEYLSDVQFIISYTKLTLFVSK
jgi:hypothetical protein